MLYKHLYDSLSITGVTASALVAEITGTSATTTVRLRDQGRLNPNPRSNLMGMICALYSVRTPLLIVDSTDVLCSSFYSLLKYDNGEGEFRG